MVDTNIKITNTSDIDFKTVQGLNATGKIYNDILEKSDSIKLNSGQREGETFKKFALKLATAIAQKEGTPIDNGQKVSEIADLLREVAKPKSSVEPTLLAHIRESNGQQPSARLDTKPVSASRPDAYGDYDDVVKNILKEIDKSYSRYNIGHEPKETLRDNREADQNESRSNWLKSAFSKTVAAVKSWTSRDKEPEISHQTARADQGVSPNPKPLDRPADVSKNQSPRFEQSFIGEVPTKSLVSSEAALSKVDFSEVPLKKASDALSVATPKTARSSDWVNFDSDHNPSRELSQANDSAKAGARAIDPDGTVVPDSSFTAERTVLSSDALHGRAPNSAIADAVELNFDPNADLARTTALFNQVKADIERDLSAQQGINESDRADHASIVSDITDPSFDKGTAISSDDYGQASASRTDPDGSYHDTPTEFKNLEAPGDFLGTESDQTGLEPKGVLASNAAEHNAPPAPHGLEPSGELLATNHPKTANYAAEYGQLSESIDELVALYNKARTNLENQIAESKPVPIVTYGEDASNISNDERKDGTVAYATAIKNQSSATANVVDGLQRASQLDDVVGSRLPNNDDHANDLALVPNQPGFDVSLADRSRDRFDSQRIEI